MTASDRAPDVTPEVVGGDEQVIDLVDAERFVAFTLRLRALRERLEETRSLTPETRSRWNRLLIRIAEDAHSALIDADERLRHLEAEADRVLGR